MHFANARLTVKRTGVKLFPANTCQLIFSCQVIVLQFARLVLPAYTCVCVYICVVGKPFYSQTDAVFIRLDACFFFLGLETPHFTILPPSAFPNAYRRAAEINAFFCFCHACFQVHQAPAAALLVPPCSCHWCARGRPFLLVDPMFLGGAPYWIVPLPWPSGTLPSHTYGSNINPQAQFLTQGEKKWCWRFIALEVFFLKVYSERFSFH